MLGRMARQFVLLASPASEGFTTGVSGIPIVKFGITLNTEIGSRERTSLFATGWTDGFHEVRQERRYLCPIPA